MQLTVAGGREIQNNSMPVPGGIRVVDETENIYSRGKVFTIRRVLTYLLFHDLPLVYFNK